MIVNKTLTLTNGQIKMAFEYFNAMLQRDGENPEFSYLCYQNASTLLQSYNAIVAGIYDDRADEEFQEVLKGADKLALEYADRDPSTGSELRNQDGSYKITERVVEFQEALTKYNEEHEEVLKTRQQKIEATMGMLNQAQEVNVIVIPVTSFPNSTPPLIVGLFGQPS